MAQTAAFVNRRHPGTSGADLTRYEESGPINRLSRGTIREPLRRTVLVTALWLLPFACHSKRDPGQPGAGSSVGRPLPSAADRLAQAGRAEPQSSDGSTGLIVDALRGHTKSELLSVLSFGASPALAIRVEPKVAGEGNLLVATYRSSTGVTSLDALDVQLFVVSTHSGKLVREASGRARFASTLCPTEGEDDRPDRSIELWPDAFEIAPVRAAFGVRLSCSISWPAGDGTETHLLLFERRDALLRQVLSVRLESDTLDRAGGIESSERGTLSVNSTLHRGYFDLKLQSTLERKSAPLDDTPVKQLGRESRAVMYEWNGTQYAARNAGR